MALNKDDRALLALAAKGTRLNIQWSSNGRCFRNVVGRKHISSCEKWNPLESDADAFRLACELSMDCNANQISVKVIHGATMHIQPANGTPAGRAKAMRRAITSIAADIGTTRYSVVG